MSRLTRRFGSEIKMVGCAKKCAECYGMFCQYPKIALEKLAHYEDLEEQSRLIELPCKVEDTLYSIVEDCNYIGSCRGMECEDCIYSLLKINPFKVSSIQHAVRIMGRFGKTIFLTKEEAEAKLAELKGGEA